MLSSQIYPKNLYTDAYSYPPCCIKGISTLDSLSLRTLLFLLPVLKLLGCIFWQGYPTDKRTDVWSRNFLIWEINFGLWAVAWAGPWEKGVWVDSEQLFWGW